MHLCARACIYTIQYVALPLTKILVKPVKMAETVIQLEEEKESEGKLGQCEIY
jgi:hypothetical protein